MTTMTVEQAMEELVAFSTGPQHLGYIQGITSVQWKNFSHEVLSQLPLIISTIRAHIEREAVVTDAMCRRADEAYNDAWNDHEGDIDVDALDILCWRAALTASMGAKDDA